LSLAIFKAISKGHDVCLNGLLQTEGNYGFEVERCSADKGRKKSVLLKGRKRQFTERIFIQQLLFPKIFLPAEPNRADGVKYSSKLEIPVAQLPNSFLRANYPTFNRLQQLNFRSRGYACFDKSL
jgi:hypothetical protein